MRLWQKAFFRLNERLNALFLSPLRKFYYRMLGLTIGDTVLPVCSMTWPHKVKIGDNCCLEEFIYFKHDGIWTPGKSILIGDRVFVGRGVEFNVKNNVSIGNDSLIASGCKFIDSNHVCEKNEVPLRLQGCDQADIELGENVWLGANVIILKGVKIGKGAVVAAGAVVNRNIPDYEIWGGVPAKKIGTRLE